MVPGDVPLPLPSRLEHGTAVVTLIEGDCLEVLPTLEPGSVHAVICDPPYGLEFMGKEWDRHASPHDYQQWCRMWAAECLRVLRPGGYLLAFGGTRTFHRLASAIEEAGFEIRDCLAWLYGSGFPKSLDVSKAIDRARDDRADILRVTSWLADQAEQRNISKADVDQSMGTSDMGGWWLSRLRHRCQVPRWEQWERLRDLIGFGPEMDQEVWRLNGRKGQPGEAWHERPVIGQRSAGIAVPGEGPRHTVGGSRAVPVNVTSPALAEARQWDGWGTALKPAFEPVVVARKPLTGTVAANVLAHGTGALNIDGCRLTALTDAEIARSGRSTNGSIYGDFSSVDWKREQESHKGRWPANVVLDEDAAVMLDEPSRFFYTAKASRTERNNGNGSNTHPTVKPVALMRWLVRLVTPPGGLVCDPFAGSGTTGVACALEGFDFLGVEREPDYAALARRRIAWAALNPADFETDDEPPPDGPPSGPVQPGLFG